MNILLVHQAFPAQFKHIAPALGADPSHRVVGFTMQKHPPAIAGVQMVSYQSGKGSSEHTHPWVRDFEAKVLRAHVAMKAARQMRDVHGFVPDLIFAHNGWGESLLLKEVWPRARVLLYSEWYYQIADAVPGFDPEFAPGGEEAACLMRVKNAHNLLAIEAADAGISPTLFQRDTHPAWFRDRIRVVHDGIDTQALQPVSEPGPLHLKLRADPACGLEAAEVDLRHGDEIVTFVNRALEPMRGYHRFMRALPEILRRRPEARVVIVGDQGAAYGKLPPSGSWKQRYLDEVRDEIDLSRVHFVGRLPYPALIRLMQLSRAHVYLTYPFVLSWSLLEAMAVGAPIVGGDTAPVREVIEDGVNGRLADFFSAPALAGAVCDMLDDAGLRERLGRRARETILDRFDLATRCLPRQLEIVREVGGG